MKIPAFDIETEEYEEERHVFDMWRWMDSKLAEMRQTGHFDPIYFERKGLNVKKLIEEAYPVAALAMSLVRHESEVRVRCFAGNQAYDAKIWVKGYYDFEMKVEATRAEKEGEAHLRREALSRKGVTWGSGPIRRSKTEAGEYDYRDENGNEMMTDIAEYNDEWVELAFGAAKRKIDRGSYDALTAILVGINPIFGWDMRWRAELDDRTRRFLESREGAVYGVYYFCEDGCLIDAVRLTQHH